MMLRTWFAMKFEYQISRSKFFSRKSRSDTALRTVLKADAAHPVRKVACEDPEYPYLTSYSLARASAATPFALRVTCAK